MIYELPIDLIATICSKTDDETIYNLVCSSTPINNVINKGKEQIILDRRNEPLYDINTLIFNYPQYSVIPYNIHNFRNMCGLNGILCENIGYREHIHRVYISDDSIDHTVIMVPKKGNLLTSIKLKGDVRNVSIELGERNTFYDNLYQSFLSLLPTDDDGYKEVLTHFTPCFSFNGLSQTEIRVRISFVGDTYCKCTYMYFDKHHTDIINNISNDFNTHAIIPHMLKEDLHVNNSLVKYFNIDKLFISKGVAVVSRNNTNTNAVRNPIKFIEVIIDNLHSHKVSSHLLQHGKITKHKLYNLPFDIKDCIYVPLEGVNFNNVESGTLKITFENDNEHNIDVIYFGYNMIFNKFGVGGRLY
jgi:hypothetical protein